MSTQRRSPVQYVEYHSWVNMIQRCTNPNVYDYPNYGGRGITVCPEWRGREGFYRFREDMGDRPEGTTLDRIDNDGDYYRYNCRWANSDVQANNKRSNYLLTYNGKTQSVARWAKELGISYSTLYTRLCNRWSVEEMLTTPVRVR